MKLAAFLWLECVLRPVSRQTTELSTTTQILEFLIYIHGTIFHGELQQGPLLGNSQRSKIPGEVTHGVGDLAKIVFMFQNKNVLTKQSDYMYSHTCLVHGTIA